MPTPRTNNPSPHLDQLKRWMILLLVVLQAVTVIAILFFSNLAGESALLAQAKKILNAATAETIGQTEAYLDNAYREVSIAAELLRTGVLEAADTRQTELYFLNQLEHNPAFAGVYLGTVSGDFLYVSRDLTRERGRYRIKHVQNDDQGARTALWWRNDETERRHATLDPAEAFDPRTRPWFREAMASDGFIWTDPYIFFTAQRLGITAARPVKDASGATIGVIGIDLELDELAGFLAAIDISESGSAFIANSEGLLIATPGMKGQAATSLASLMIDAMADPVSRQVLDTIRAASRTSSKSSATTFTVGKTRYIANSMPMRLSDGEQWLIGTYAARSDFLADIRESDRRNLYLAIGILLIALAIGALLANSAWTPLELLHSQANRDQLTHAFNRHYLMKHGKRLFAEARQQGEALSVAIVDLDHFKQINDTRGHAAGDAVIKAFAKRLQQASRSHDVVARYGGEEFVVLLPTACAATAKSVLERARSQLSEQPIVFRGQAIPVTFSAGVCEISAELNAMEPVLSAADKALYQAKQAGRDRIVVAKRTSSKTPDGSVSAAVALSH